MRVSVRRQVREAAPEAGRPFSPTLIIEDTSRAGGRRERGTGQETTTPTGFQRPQCPQHTHTHTIIYCALTHSHGVGGQLNYFYFYF